MKRFLPEQGYISNPLFQMIVITLPFTSVPYIRRMVEMAGNINSRKATMRNLFSEDTEMCVFSTTVRKLHTHADCKVPVKDWIRDMQYMLHAAIIPVSVV